MKDFIVKNTYDLPLFQNEWFLVKANNKEDAITKVHNLYGKSFARKEYKAYTLKEFYADEEVVVIH